MIGIRIVSPRPIEGRPARLWLLNGLGRVRQVLKARNRQFREAACMERDCRTGMRRTVGPDYRCGGLSPRCAPLIGHSNWTCASHRSSAFFQRKMPQASPTKYRWMRARRIWQAAIKAICCRQATSLDWNGMRRPHTDPASPPLKYSHFTSY